MYIFEREVKCFPFFVVLINIFSKQMLGLFKHFKPITSGHLDFVFLRSIIEIVSVFLKPEI